MGGELTRLAAFGFDAHGGGSRIARLRPTSSSDHHEVRQNRAPLVEETEPALTSRESGNRWRSPVLATGWVGKGSSPPLHDLTARLCLSQL